VSRGCVRWGVNTPSCSRVTYVSSITLTYAQMALPNPRYPGVARDGMRATWRTIGFHGIGLLRSVIVVQPRLIPTTPPIGVSEYRGNCRVARYLPGVARTVGGR
jgi:hypothetical protein